MDASNPYDRPSRNKRKDEESKKKEPKQEEENEYKLLTSDDEDDEEDELDDDAGGSLDGDDSDFEDEPPFYKTPKGMGIIGGGALVLIIILFLVFKKDAPEVIVPEQEPEVEVDQTQVQKDELYKLGIGKEAVSEKNIFEQGPIESKDFRKDFVNMDAPENYVHPLKIIAVNDSVSYTKHRTMTDDGMDMYWVDAEYKSKKTRFTIPYYIWQTLTPQGVMDIIAEVVTDADGKTFVTSITARPPTEED